MVTSMVERSGSTDTEVQAVAHLTALEQQREDQALGAAWRRCETALPEGWEMAVGSTDQPNKYSAGAYTSDNVMQLSQHLATPTAALEALADALEARRAAE